MGSQSSMVALSQKNGRRGPLTSRPSNIWSSHRRMAQFETANAVEQHRRATRGNTGLDLSSATQLVLTHPHGGPAGGFRFQRPYTSRYSRVDLRKKLCNNAGPDSPSWSHRFRLYRTSQDHDLFTQGHSSHLPWRPHSSVAFIT